MTKIQIIQTVAAGILTLWTLTMAAIAFDEYREKNAAKWLTASIFIGIVQLWRLGYIGG